MAHHVVLTEVVVDMAGTDWKSALAALGGSNEENESEEKKSEEKKDVDRKKRVGVVYSTNPDYGYSKDAEDESSTLPKNQQKLRLNMERAGRGGKTVTLVKGFVGSDDDINALCKLLKQKCGVGGSVKDGELIIQGDHRQRLVEILKKEGYTQAK
jgi:translation initiation factor 1